MFTRFYIVQKVSVIGFPVRTKVTNLINKFFTSESPWNLFVWKPKIHSYLLQVLSRVGTGVGIISWPPTVPDPRDRLLVSPTDRGVTSRVVNKDGDSETQGSCVLYPCPDRGLGILFSGATGRITYPSSKNTDLERPDPIVPGFGTTTTGEERTDQPTCHLSFLGYEIQLFRTQTLGRGCEWSTCSVNGRLTRR